MLYSPVVMSEFEWNIDSASKLFDELRSLPQEDPTAISIEDVTSYIQGHLDLLIKKARERVIDRTLPGEFLQLGANTLWEQFKSPEAVLTLYRNYYLSETTPGQQISAGFETVMARIASESEEEERQKAIDSTFRFIERHEWETDRMLRAKINFAQELEALGLDDESFRIATKVQASTPRRVLSAFGLDKDLDFLLKDENK